MSYNQRDIGALITHKISHIGVAQGATNEAEVSGRDFDRLGDLSQDDHQSIKLCVFGLATLQSGATMALAANFQHGDTTGAGYTDTGDALASTVVATGPSGGGEVEFRTELDMDLSTCKRYVRGQVTPLFSATGTDTMVLAANLVVGGGRNVPAA